LGRVCWLFGPDRDFRWFRGPGKDPGYVSSACVLGNDPGQGSWARILGLDPGYGWVLIEFHGCCECLLGRPGNDLLSQVLRHSTIGAEEFNGRVRDGIGFGLLASATRPAKQT
jgi:hypothetical protein